MDLKCWASIEKHMFTILSYSARGIFHMGKYNECLNSEGMKYNLILLGPKGAEAGSINSGLCLPESCTSEMVKSGINFLLSKAQFPYEAITVKNDTEYYHYPYDIAFFLTLFILICLCIFVALASFSKSFEHHPFIGFFSIQHSMKIFKYNPKSRLNVLNGVKSLAMIAVIFGHVYSYNLNFQTNTLTLEKNQLSNWKTLVLLSALYAVDTFFFVGGLLVSYAVLKEASASLLKYPLAVLNRYLRLVPSYLMAILIFYCFLIHLVSGPFVFLNENAIKACDPIWRPLLFVDNLVDNGATMCMGWGWYLQNDMQMFVFSMFFLLVYKYSRFWSFITIYLSTAISFAFTFQQTFDHNYHYNTHISDISNDYQLNIYYKPWARCPPYFYGILFGILYHEFLMAEKKIDYEENDNFLIKMKEKFEHSQWLRRFVELFGIVMILFVCFIPRTAQGDHYWPQLAHSFYLTYGKFGFVFGVSLVILPSLLSDKNHSLVMFVLDTKVFNFIAKVSYTTYLIHLTILIWYFLNKTQESYYDFTSIFPAFVSMTVISIIFGFAFTLLVQIPCSKIQKKIMHALFLKGSKTKFKKQRESHSGEEQKMMSSENQEIVEPKMRLKEADE